MSAWLALRGWTGRHWATAVLAAGASMLVVGVPTDLIDTPLFGRQIPPTAWAWPALAVSAILGGLLAATYVGAAPITPPEARRSAAGWLLTFFAVGCPTCNKLVLLALGNSGAVNCSGEVVKARVTEVSHRCDTFVTRRPSGRLPRASDRPSARGWLAVTTSR